MSAEDMTPESSTPKPQSRYRGKEWTSREAEDAARGAYRRVEPLAVVSLVLGVLAFLPMFGWPMIPVPIAGIFVGLIALRQIANLPGERTGRDIAIGGIVLSIVFGLVGVAAYLQIAHGVPIGYKGISFLEMQPDEDLGEVIPEEILELEGKFVFVRGFMYPGRRSTGIQQFVLVPTQWHCKFCQRELSSTEMIRVTMTGDLLADYTGHMVGVGGKLRIDHREALKPLGGMPYEIEADVFRD